MTRLAARDRRQQLAAGESRYETGRLLGCGRARDHLDALDVHLVDQRRRRARLGQRFGYETERQQAFADTAVADVGSQAEQSRIAQGVELLTRELARAVDLDGVGRQHIGRKLFGAVQPLLLRTRQREVRHLWLLGTAAGRQVVAE